MSDVTLPIERRRFQFDWVWPSLRGPGAFFARLAEYDTGAWLTPLMIVAAALGVRVLADGLIQTRLNEMTGGPVPPPDSVYWTPDQLNAWMQAQSMQTGPMFVYGFPLLGVLLGLVIGWVLTFAVLHLVLTLLGGRGSLRSMMNVAAWASLPLALRALVSATAVFFTGQLINGQGLSGFGPTGEVDAGGAFVAALLALIDLYWLWHVLQLVIGSHAAVRLPRGKIWFGVLLTAGVVLALQALPGFIQAQTAGFEVIRMF
ncbi:MAG TPA: YIP1 family protein [Anaerolineales bacterium]|nr:YIP1 family protein [Anaerolineales bacterium]